MHPEHTLADIGDKQCRDVAIPMRFIDFHYSPGKVNVFFHYYENPAGTTALPALREGNY